VLEVAEAMNGLLGRIAARNFDRRLHLSAFRQLMQDLEGRDVSSDPEQFAHTRRRYYRTLLDTAANRELDRHFSAINMQIVYAQYPSTRLQAIRVEDYLAICHAISCGNVRLAETTAKRHVKRVREIVQQLAMSAAEDG
jgi:DNA-binding GntR family transcriptional regulator